MSSAVSALSRLRAITASPVLIAVIAALLFAANLFGEFPGVANDDSDSQYAQAVDQRFNDWHPPVMAWLWSIFRLVADGNGPMFCFHVACYWLGFGLIAVALGRASRPLAAWGIIGVGLFPPFLMMNINILKDVGLAVTFLAAFAVLFWYRIEDRRAPAAIIVISSILLFYGTLVRSNAVFGVVPLVAYLINPQWLGRPWRVLALSAPVAMLMVPVSGLFNHNVLNATPLGIIRSLEIFDLTGIAFYSGDLSVLGPGDSFTRQDMERRSSGTHFRRGENVVFFGIGWPYPGMSKRSRSLPPWMQCRLAPIWICGIIGSHRSSPIHLLMRGIDWPILALRFIFSLSPTTATSRRLAHQRAKKSHRTSSCGEHHCTACTTTC